MSSEDWFRNTNWDDDIATAFEQKLARARLKSDYLRIQGSTLARKHPSVALALLGRYFALGEHFDHAQAHVDRADAYLALGDLEASIAAYEAALAREQCFPKLKTSAYFDLPYLIATLGLESRFARAMEILDGSTRRLHFPLDRFRYHATRAIILARSSRPAGRLDALAALEAATAAHSGFKHHPKAGLVSKEHAVALSLLSEIVGFHQAPLVR